MMKNCINVYFRWQKLLGDSEQRKQTLLRLQDQYRQIEDLYLAFAKKASAFNSWFENAEEDLTDPVRCNSVEEIRVSHFTFTQYVQKHILSSRLKSLKQCLEYKLTRKPHIDVHHRKSIAVSIQSYIYRYAYSSIFFDLRYLT